MASIPVATLKDPVIKEEHEKISGIMGSARERIRFLEKQAKDAQRQALQECDPYWRAIYSRLKETGALPPFFTHYEKKGCSLNISGPPDDPHMGIVTVEVEDEEDPRLSILKKLFQ